MHKRTYSFSSGAKRLDHKTQNHSGCYGRSHNDALTRQSFSDSFDFLGFIAKREPTDEESDEDFE